MFSGSVGSGESEIRKWIVENDILEAIAALPDQLFYNTGIYTYIWIVTNAKAPERQGKIQLINGIHYYKKMSRSLGNKRNVIGDGVEVMPDQIAEITQIYGEFQQSIKTALGSLGEKVYQDRERFDKVLTKALKALKIAAPVKKAIMNALAERDETAEICTDKDGNPEPDSDLRDYENVPLKDDIDEYMRREVLPHVPDAWVDESKTRIGYEIPFTRHFYEYVPPRPLAEIEREIKDLEDEIRGMLDLVL